MMGLHSSSTGKVKDMFGKLAHIVEPPSIAVDLGTANTRIYAFNLGKMIEKPSSIRLVKDQTNDVSDEYFKYINSTLVTAPLRGGVIVDLKNTISLLKPLVIKTKKLFKSPISLACAPTDTTETERGLLRSALLAAGASRVSVIPEVWAAAAGAGMDVTLPTAQLIVDIGDGVTDLAVFRERRIVFSSALRVACGDIHKAVRSAIMAKYKIKVYEHEVERLTDEISTTLSQEPSRRSIHISGIDVVKRCEVGAWIDNKVVVDAILPVVNRITEMIEKSLQKIPKKFHPEIMESGICLTGGGACIEGMGQLIAVKTHVAVKIAPDPLHAVINGASLALQSWSGKKSRWDNITWPQLPA